MTPMTSPIGPLLIAEGDVVISLTPGVATSDNFTKFRWNMQIPLPFPFPARNCVKQEIVLEGMAFSFEIHNHFDRITQHIQLPGMPPQLRGFFITRGTATPQPPPGCQRVTREPLQSVVFFNGKTDFPLVQDVVACVDKMRLACFQYLSAYLAACQRNAPYFCAWLVYPVSIFDIGTAFHEIRAYCIAHQMWELCSSGFHVSVGRKLTQPTFFIDPPTTLEGESPLDTANELLAEAMMSLYRGVPRLTVLNSYGAVEGFANAVFTKLRVAQYMSDGVPEKYAKQFSEDQRQKHRTEGAFLYHRGLKEACGRSLLEEEKQIYEDLLKFQKVRHDVAHTGFKPAFEAAQQGHKLCCQAIQWFSGVGGFSVKPLLAQPDSTSVSVAAAVVNCSE